MVPVSKEYFIEPKKTETKLGAGVGASKYCNE